jgi:cell division protease FtsH
MRLFRFGRAKSDPNRPGRSSVASELLVLAQAKVETLPAEVVELCDRALAGGADEGWALEVRGLARQQLNQHDLAWTDLERAAGLGRRSAPLFRARWMANQNAGRYEEALADIDRAIVFAPQTGEFHYRRAFTLSWLCRWDEVFTAAGAAILLGFETDAVHQLRGHALFAAGRFHEAASAYTEALRTRPNLCQSLVYRARCRWRLDQTEEAEEDFDTAEDFHPVDPEPPFERGKLLFNAGEFGRAADCFERVVDLKPADKGYRFWQGAAYCQLGLYDLAVDEFDAVLVAGSTDATDYRWTGQARYHLRDAEGALAAFDRSLELDPTSANAHGWRGWVLADLGRWEEARSAYDEAIRLDPDSAHYREQRSKIWDRLGRDDLAAADFATCEDLEIKANPPPEMNTPATDVYPIVRAHFADAPLEHLSLTERFFPARVSPDVQRALDALSETEFAVDQFFCPKQNNNTVYNFQALYTRDRRNPITRAAPHHFEADIGEEHPVRCLWNGVWLLTYRDTRLAVLTTADQNHRRFQVAAPSTPAGQAATDAFLALVEAAISRGACYRGKVLSLDADDDYDGTINGIKVHRLRAVRREDVILPQATLDLLDRNVIEFVGARPQLRDLGLSTRKGILFYGPPGTGKTHTIHYLAAALPATTTFLISAEQVGHLADYMSLARLFQPSLVVLEDVDLIARERRALRSGVEETLLNRLLNEMDGLKPDADILFVLTTNAPAALEDALANRPGRVDQAIEFPYPDVDGRAKLVRMYAGKAILPDHLVERVVGGTKDTSPAFIKELMRRAAQYAVVRGSTILTEPDVDGALTEMLTTGVNSKLFGFGGRSAG